MGWQGSIRRAGDSEWEQRTPRTDGRGADEAGETKSASSLSSLMI